MFLISFFIVLSISTTLINKTNDVGDETKESYSYDKQSMKIILWVLVASILLEILFNVLKGVEFVRKLHFPALGAYILLSVISIVVANKIRLESIKKRREETLQIFSMIKICLPKDKQKEMDFDNPPFELEYQKGKVWKIIIKFENPSDFNDNFATTALASLNKYLPHAVWISDNSQLLERTFVFKGTKLPPTMAGFPGTWLRPNSFIPLGVNGIGEVSWNMGNPSKKELGRSMFKYEDGTQAGTINVASAPQAMTVGSTGGGKAIWVGQEIIS